MMKQIVHTFLIIVFLLPALYGFSSDPSRFNDWEKGGNQVGSERYLELVDSACRLYKDGKLLGAEQLTRDALRLEPANPGNLFLFSNLGMILNLLGRNEEAVQLLDICVERAPVSTTFRKNRAAALLGCGRDEDALSDMGVILDNDSINEWALQSRILLLLRVKKFDSALPDIERLMKFYPGNPWGYAGKAQIRMAQGDLSGAADLFGTAYAKEQHPEFIFNRILMLAESGKTNEGMKELNEAIKKTPDSGNLYLLRGFINRQTYQKEAAEADFRTAIEKGADPNLLPLFRSPDDSK